MRLLNASLIEPYPTALDQTVEAALPIGTPNSESTLSNQMNQLINLLANFNISSASDQHRDNQLDRHNRGASQYHYRGDRRSAGLEDCFRSNSYKHNYRRGSHGSGYRSNSRGNYSYHPTPPRQSFNFQNQGQYRPYQNQGQYRPYQNQGQYRSYQNQGQNRPYQDNNRASGFLGRGNFSHRQGNF